MIRVLLVFALSLFVLSPAAAQNTAGVFGPIVNDGHKLAEYRYSVVEPTDNFGAPSAQRVFYEQALNDRLMGRLEYQWRDVSEQADTEFDFLRAMLWIDAGKVTERWHTGFRLDARIRDGSRPDDFAVSWTNQFELSPKVFARFVQMAFYDFGDRVENELAFETRSSVTRLLDGGHAAGVEMYNVWGRPDPFPAFDDTRHEIAPFVNWRLSPDWSLYTSAGFGLSDAAPDNQFRLRVGRRF